MEWACDRSRPRKQKPEFCLPRRTSSKPRNEELKVQKALARSVLWALVPPSGTDWSCCCELPGAITSSPVTLDGRVFSACASKCCCFFLTLRSGVALHQKKPFLLLANWPHFSWLIMLDPVRDLCSQLDQMIIVGPFKLELNSIYSFLAWGITTGTARQELLEQASETAACLHGLGGMLCLLRQQWSLCVTGHHSPEIPCVQLHLSSKNIIHIWALPQIFVLSCQNGCMR